MHACTALSRAPTTADVHSALDIYPWRQALSRDGVEYIVAPYEADAQMAYMALSDDVDAVITEDSDLLAYGCPKARTHVPSAFHLICISSSQVQHKSPRQLIWTS